MMDDLCNDDKEGLRRIDSHDGPIGNADVIFLRHLIDRLRAALAAEREARERAGSDRFAALRLCDEREAMLKAVEAANADLYADARAAESECDTLRAQLQSVEASARLWKETAQEAVKERDRARRETLEEAAKVCDAGACPDDNCHQDECDSVRMAATAIRALANTPEGGDDENQMG
jgi:hypothetical protein